MKKKNILKLSIAVVLCLCMVFAFIGCSDDTSDSTASDENTTVQTPTPSGGDGEETEDLDGEGTDSGAASGDYNISDGMTVEEVSPDSEDAIFYGNGFELVMPNTGTWSFTAESSDSVKLYYMDGESAGYGGDLVTITAFDMDDTSYEEFPSYAVAGENASLGKRFVARFPTDVRYDPNDETQAEEYMLLFDHVKTIGGSGSPFSCVEKPAQAEEPVPTEQSEQAEEAE